MSTPISDEDSQQIRAAVFAGRRIAAIKHYRDSSGKGLNEAMDFIDTLERELRSVAPETAPPAEKRSSWIPGLFCWACAVVCGLWAIFDFAKIVPLLVIGQEAEGVVARLVPAQEEGDIPIIQFQSDQGAVEIKGAFVFPHGYRVGDKVRVLYLPKKPQEGRVKGFSGMWAEFAFRCAIATVFVAVWCMIRIIKRFRAATD